MMKYLANIAIKESCLYIYGTVTIKNTYINKK